jgi:hypothetical protein
LRKKREKKNMQNPKKCGEKTKKQCRGKTKKKKDKIKKQK